MIGETWTRYGPVMAGALVIAAGATIGVTAPGMGGYLLTLVITAVFFAYLAQCWNIVGGYAGRFSFGHAAFVGVGAYTTTVLGKQFGINPWLGMLVGAALAAVLGAALAAVSFRFGVRGPYFALSTLALAETLRVVFTNWEFVGAARGLMIDFVPGSSFAQLQFSSRLPYLYLILGLAAAVTLLVWLLDRHRIGLYLRALREDETVAASLGVDCQRYATYASALSAALTAIGGAFYAQWLLFIEAPTVFGVEMSIAMVIPVLLGGIGTVWGPLLGALALSPLQEGARALFRDRPGADLVVYGFVIAIVIIFLPRGMMGLFHRSSSAARASEPPRPSASGVEPPSPADRPGATPAQLAEGVSAP